MNHKMLTMWFVVFDRPVKDFVDLLIDYFLPAMVEAVKCNCLINIMFLTAISGIKV